MAVSEAIEFSPDILSKANQGQNWVHKNVLKTKTDSVDSLVIVPV